MATPDRSSGSPFSFRQIANFWLITSIFYIALNILWPILGKTYAFEYCAIANAVSTTLEGGEVRFEPVISPMDVRITIRSGSSPGVETMVQNSRILGYLPTAQVIALLLTSSIRGRARGRLPEFLFGLLLVHLFIILRMEITLIRILSEDRPWATYHPSSYWRGALDAVFARLVAEPSGALVISMFIWLTVSLPRWKRGDRSIT